MPSGIGPMGPVGPSSISPSGDSSSPNQTLNDILNKLSALGANFYTNQQQPTSSQVSQLAKTIIGQLMNVKSFLQSSMNAGDFAMIYGTGPHSLMNSLNNAVNTGQVSSLFSSAAPVDPTCDELQFIVNAVGSSLDGNSVSQVGFLTLTHIYAQLPFGTGQSPLDTQISYVNKDFSANQDETFQSIVAQVPQALSYVDDNWENPTQCQAQLQPYINACHNYFYGS